MNKQSQLQQQAIIAAKKQDWVAAADLNQMILDSSPQDLGALNRLGVAYLQLDKNKDAKKCFQQVLDIDKSNSIARKHLTNIKNNQTSTPPQFAREHFIEEPGKTKIVELHRLASKNTLEKFSVGQACELKPKNRYISVESNKEYIGALPEDLSFRLSKLINTGNEYSCFVHSLSDKSCSVYIKELKRSAVNDHINSFPLIKGTLAAINDIDERFLLEDDIPIEIVHTDTDEEKVFDEVNTEEAEEPESDED